MVHSIYKRRVGGGSKESAEYLRIHSIQSYFLLPPPPFPSRSFFVRLFMPHPVIYIRPSFRNPFNLKRILIGVIKIFCQNMQDIFSFLLSVFQTVTQCPVKKANSHGKTTFFFESFVMPPNISSLLLYYYLSLEMTALQSCDVHGFEIIREIIPIDCWSFKWPLIRFLDFFYLFFYPRLLNWKGKVIEPNLLYQKGIFRNDNKEFTTLESILLYKNIA